MLKVACAHIILLFVFFSAGAQLSELFYPSDLISNNHINQLIVIKHTDDDVQLYEKIYFNKEGEIDSFKRLNQYGKDSLKVLSINGSRMNKLRYDYRSNLKDIVELRFNEYGSIIESWTKINPVVGYASQLEELDQKNKINYGEVLEVRSVKAFLGAIGDDREIKILVDTIDLNAVDSYDSTEYYYWNTVVGGGKELIINDVYNLKISGLKDTMTLFLTEASNANILSFLRSDIVELNNIAFSHSNDNLNQSGGGICLDTCADVVINRCAFFGNNSRGVELNQVDDLVFKFSDINGATENVLSISESNNIHFRKSVFSNNYNSNGEISLIKDVSDIEFLNCTFKNNGYDQNIYVLDSIYDGSIFQIQNGNEVHFNNCNFFNNNVGQFIDSQDRLPYFFHGDLTTDFYNNLFQMRGNDFTANILIPNKTITINPKGHVINLKVFEKSSTDYFYDDANLIIRSLTIDTNQVPVHTLYYEYQ